MKSNNNELKNAIQTVKEVFEQEKKLNEDRLSPFVYTQREDGKYVILGIKKDAPYDLHIPSCVAEIARLAFNGAYITSVTFAEGLETIGDYAFIQSCHIKELVFPSTMNRIGAHAFDTCSQLRSVTFPKGLNEIGAYAFSGCASLTTLFIPSSVEKIDGDAFMLCGNLKDIYCEANEKPTDWSDRWISDYSHTTVYWGRPDSTPMPKKKQAEEKLCSDTELFEYTELEDGSLIINGFRNYNQITDENGEKKWVRSEYDFNSVTTVILPPKTAFVNQGAFFNQSSIRKIVLPDTVVGIGETAFYGCVSLEDINLPSSLLTIERSAFHDCVSLQSVTVPDSILNMGASVFSGCPKLREIRFPDIMRRGLIYPWSNGCLATITLYPTDRTDDNYEATEYAHYLTAKTDKGITVASVKNRYSIKAIIPEGTVRIGRYAFSQCPNITQIIIPKTVTSIDEKAFSQCPKLEEISVHRDNPSFSSADGVLYSKKRKKLIRYPMGKFGDFTVPASVMNIATNAFHESNGLCAVTVPAKLGKLDENTFRNCPRLTADKIIRS